MKKCIPIELGFIKFDDLEVLNNKFRQKGIYFLYEKSKCVYIGQSSSCIFNRILSHDKDTNKIFDTVYIWNLNNIEDSALIKIEEVLISLLRPTYNKTKSSYMYSYDSFQEGISELKDVLEYQNGPTVKDSNEFINEIDDIDYKYFVSNFKGSDFDNYIEKRTEKLLEEKIGRFYEYILGLIIEDAHKVGYMSKETKLKLKEILINTIDPV